MPFPGHPVGENPHAICQAQPSRFKSLIAFHGNQPHLRALLKQPGHDLLILPHVKGAGGIHQHAAGLQKIRRLQNQLFLNLAVILRPPLLPGADHGRILPEHALAGTGGVHQHLVEKFRHPFGQFFRILADHIDVGEACQLQVFQKRPGSGAADIVGRQKALSLKLRPQLRGLSSGRRAQIQHPVPGFHRKAAGRGHGAGFLQIVQAGIIIGVPGGLRAAVIRKSIGNPRNPLHPKRQFFLQLIRRDFPPVGSKAAAGLFPAAFQISLVLSSQKLLHLFGKGGGQLYRISQIVLLPTSPDHR